MSPFTGIPATGNGCGVDHRNNHIPTAGPTTTPGHPRCQPHLKTDDKTGDTTRNRRIDYEINAIQLIRNEASLLRLVTTLLTTPSKNRNQGKPTSTGNVQPSSQIESPKFTEE
jgi:hypothetical protein